MIAKNFNIKLDVSSNIIYRTNIEVVQNDKDTNIFNFTLYQGATVIDLTTVTNQTITFKLTNGKVYVGKPTVVNALLGTMTYTLQTDDMSRAGLVNATVELFEGESRLSSCIFSFKIREDLNADGSGYVSTNDFPTLAELITASNNEPTREANEAIRIANEDAREDAEILRMISEEDRQNEFNAMIQNGFLIWQTPVQNFSDLAIVYPTPSINWTVQVINDSGKVYRFDGSSWAYVFTANITNIANYYKWREEKTILTGSSTITLTNSYNSATMKLEVFDKKYGCQWFKDVHFTVSGQVMTFDVMTEDLTFVITAI